MLGLVFLVHPRNTFLVYLVSRPLIELDVNARIWKVSLGQLWSGGAILMMAFLLLFIYNKRNDLLHSYALAGVFLLAYPMFTFWRPGASTAFMYEIKMITWVLLILVIERISLDREGQSAVMTTAISMAAVLTGVMFYAYASNLYGSSYYYFTSGTGPHGFSNMQEPHGLANLGVMLIPFAIISLKRKRLRYVSAPLLLALISGIVLSYVRSAWLGIVVMVATYIIIAPKRYRSRVLLAIGVAFIPAAVIALSMRSDILTRLEHGNTRLPLWKACFYGTVETPMKALFGGGASECTNDIVRLHMYVWSNSDFVELLGSGGIILLVIYLLYVLWLFAGAARLSRNKRRSIAVRDVGSVGVAACAAYASISLMNGVLWNAVSLGFAMFIGFVRGISNMPGEESVPRKSESRWRNLW
jgi:hypothetical protein